MKALVLERMLDLDYKNVSEKIEDFIRSSVDLFEKKGVIVGLSGGLDSSTLATLSVRALGRDRVFGLLMPERDSEPQNFRDAEQLASELKIDYEILDITPILRKMGIYELLPDKIAKNKKLLMETLKEAKRASTFEAKPTKLPIIGIKSGSLGYCFTFPKVRVRSIMLHYRACLKKLVVAGTITKSEYVTSTYDEHGDGACDIAPLRNLYKSQVRRLAQYLGVPKNIVTKPSSPDLIAGSVVTDEVLIGMNYETLDSILYCIEKGMKISEIARELEVEESTVERVANSVEMAKLRREMPFTPTL
jgi:NAD+ synthase